MDCKVGRTPKNSCLELWCWRRLLRVTWTAQVWNQSILRKINPEYSLKGLMLKLKLQYFSHLMWTAKSLEKSLMLKRLRAGEEGIRGWDGWMVSSMKWTWTCANCGRWWGTGRPGVRQSMESQKVENDCATEQQQQHFLWSFSQFTLQTSKSLFYFYSFF